MARDFDELWDFDDPAGTEQRFRALLDGAGDQPPGYRAELLTQIARCQGLQRQFEQAHAMLDEAEQMIESGSDSEVRYLLERGRVLNSSGQWDEARPLFLRAWELGHHNQADFYAVDAAHMLAIVGPPEEVDEWHSRAVAVAARSSDQRARGWLGSLYNNIGWAHHGAGRYEEALEAFEKALDARQEHDQHDLALVATWCIGRALRSLGRLDEALELQLNLERRFDELGRSDGFVSEEIGECMHALGRSAAARPHFDRAHEILSQDAWLAENEPDRLARLARLAGS